MAKNSSPHIGIFGRRNVGKSSLINSLIEQNIAIVSEKPGTTTDPVSKTYELTGIGPVVLIDTAGVDDEEKLIGSLRVEKTLQIIPKIDLAILVLANNEFSIPEEFLLEKFKEYKTPFIVVHNKSDITKVTKSFADELLTKYNCTIQAYSSLLPTEKQSLVESIRAKIPESVFQNLSLLGDLVTYGDVVLLVTPIDIEAPVGRLILPQVQTIRDCLDNECITIVCKEKELEVYWKKIGVIPKLVVTDSQVFLKAAASIPPGIPLTSFSILQARLKGDFQLFLKSTPKIAELQDGDTILILESCSHHVAGDDIGRVKIPRWLNNYSGKKLNFEFTAGLDPLPTNLQKYALIIQCGGCMLTKKQMLNRILPAKELNIPITNYGLTIAWCLGIFNRAITPFLPSSNLNQNSSYIDSLL